MTIDLDYRRLALHISKAADFHGWRSTPVGKEPWTVAWLEAIPQGATVYDIGACVGSYALISAALGHVTVAIEPGAPSFAFLVQHTRMNDLAEKLIPLCLAVGDRDGIGWFSYVSCAPGAASHSLGDATNPAVWRQAVPVLRLDDVVKMFGLPPPTHVKLDVDGLELAVIAGATECLKQVRSLLVEVRPDLLAAVIEAVTASGLTLTKQIDERGLFFCVFERPASELSG